MCAQKVKALLEEHPRANDLRAAGETHVWQEAEARKSRQIDLGREKRALRSELREQQLANAESLVLVKLEGEEECSRLRREHSQQVTMQDQKWEKRLRLQRDDMELSRKVRSAK